MPIFQLETAIAIQPRPHPRGAVKLVNGLPSPWWHPGLVAVLGIFTQLTGLLPAQIGQPLGNASPRQGAVQWQPTSAPTSQPSGPARPMAAVSVGDPEALRQRAEALARRGRISEALGIVRGLLRTDPADAGLRLMEAQYLSWLGRTATAAGRYQRLMAELPDDAAAAEGFGNTQLWRANWREAHSAYAAAVSGGGGGISAQVGSQRALLGAGRASAAYRQATELDRRTGGQDAELGLFLASVNAQVDNDEAAFQLARRRTQDPDVRLRQASFQALRLIARGQKEEGLQFISREAGHHPQDYSWLVAVGEAFAAAGVSREAHDYYTQAQRIAPDRDEALISLASLLRQQGKHRDSLALYEEVVRRNPESLPGWLGVAEVAQLRGDLDHAWQALDAAQRVAPGSALIYRERLKIALRRKDDATFATVLQAYRRAQPADAWPELWAAKWADARGAEVNVPALEAVLDPLAPDLTGEALRILRQRTGRSLPQAIAAVPRAPTSSLQEAAQDKLSRQVRLANPSIIGVSTGYEFSSLQDTTGAGARLQSWHEGYLAAYWRRQLGMALSGEYRTFSRFGASANQLLLGWNTHVTPGWIVGVEAGGALNGGFIPRWRIGAQTEYFFTDELSASLSVNHLHFAAEPVLQVIPGLTWQWHPRWSSQARMYVTHDAPKGAGANTGFAGLFSTTWQFTPMASTTLTYALGEENATQLIKGLIGEKNFQSIGMDLKWGFNEHLSLQPTYRYESHNLFDLHAIGLNLQLRY